ncbi:uncharacterized protein G2W53_037968 [Senna tora]|uniref:Uncharacterized protein n=1 Tax=Senna tora TaxID=362788 RepID=A0A834W1I1_9FABA|nr:uncharacterized protein G2W53_037968 [Senna tora]
MREKRMELLSFAFGKRSVETLTVSPKSNAAFGFIRS